MRTALALTALALAGCQSPPPRQQPSASPTTLSASSQTITTPSRPAPSLEQAQQQQAAIAATSLKQKTGIAVEPITGAAPSWWPVGGTAPGLGRGQAPTIDTAYQAAVRQARNSSTGGLGIVKAAYARLTSGEYIVWVQAGTAATTVTTAATPAQPAEQPVASNPPATANTATPPTAAPANAAPDAPPWFTTTAREENGRVFIGASADAPNVREAPRMAIEAARAALSAVLGRDVTDLRPESTYVKPLGDQYRAYVLVSSPGTIRK